LIFGNVQPHATQIDVGVFLIIQGQFCHLAVKIRGNGIRFGFGKLHSTFAKFLDEIINLQNFNPIEE